MNITEIAQALELKVTVGEDEIGSGGNGRLVGDLLSDVMGHAAKARSGSPAKRIRILWPWLISRTSQALFS